MTSTNPVPWPSTETLLRNLHPWLLERRWFPLKGDAAPTPGTLNLIADRDLGGGVHDLLIEAPRGDAAGTSVLVHAPLVAVPIGSLAGYRVDGEAPENAGLVLDDASAELVDGPHHPGFWQAWAAAAEAAGTVMRPEHARAIAQRAHRLKVTTGEQSNTSVILPAPLEDAPTGGAEDEGTTDLIVKVFRVLAAGRNPDVEVSVALAKDGWDRVRTPVAWSTLTWINPTGAEVEADSAVATTFVPRADDGFELFCELARSDDGADGPRRSQARGLAADLGITTGQMHEHLAAALGTSEPATPAELAAALRGRADWALAEVPDLGVRVPGLADGVRGILAELAALPRLDPATRVHGDYHLGQTLHEVGGEGRWYVLDFEGEPLRPLAERSEPDQPLRDVAGMLRSFDYAAAVGGAQDPSWLQEVRDAFMRGYRSAVPGDEDGTARVELAALELDKALYEAVYEARNRPDWIGIPVGGLTAILASAEASPDAGSPAAGPRTATDDAPGQAPSANARQSDPAHGRVASMTDVTPSPTPSAVHVDPWVLADVAYGRYYNPHEVLGAHVGEGGVTVRTVRHLADAVAVVTPDGTFPAEHEQDGVWVAVLPGETVPDYRVQVTYGEETTTVDDPYRFLPTLGEMDTYLISEGRHEELWEVLGSHVKHYSGDMGEVEGTAFAVWAPNARAVRVVGDFNYWDGTATPMRSLGSSGVWELFIPGVGAGARYKYEICYNDGSWHQKADPLARATEVPPATASVVTDSEYAWGDDEWMRARTERDPHNGPVSVYEVQLGSWRQGLGYRGLAEELVPYVQEAGFTHVEFLPVAEHPFGGSWGYQVSGYYAPTSRFGTPNDFRYLVDRLHQAGIGVILDWVPAHFPKDDWALGRFDGTPLYEDPDPQRGEHPDWGTYIFNFGRNEVRNFLVANALYWLGEFHADGLRVDAVASMLYLDYSRDEGQWHPNQFGGRENLEAISFLQEATATAYRRNPGTMMIAEESTAWPGVTAPTEYGGLGFGLKWNMGWMNDTLRYMAEEPINRRYHHGELTFSLVYAFSEQFVLPLSHDEVVHGKGSLLSKMPGDAWQELANLRALYAYQWSHPGKQLLFMGQEFGQGAEWNADNSLDWWILDDPGHQGLLKLVTDLNALYKDSPALWADDFSHRGFEWIEAGDGDHNVLSYLRKGTGPDGHGDLVVAIVNFAGAPHEGYRVGLPFAGGWDEVINTDAPEYGGSGVTNQGHVEAEELPWNGRPASVSLRVPPLGAVFLRPSRD